MTPDQLDEAAKRAGFLSESYEKVYALLELLDLLAGHPFAGPRLALKGGTALNVFVFDLPRLSVDIDLNFIGVTTREEMLAEKPLIEKAVEQIVGRLKHRIVKKPDAHAGGKWVLEYERADGRKGELQLDIIYTLRTPLWPTSEHVSRAVGTRTTKVKLLDKHELAAGKLAATVARSASRDVFDARALLKDTTLDDDKLRLAFTLYGSWNKVDWLTRTPESVTTTANDVFTQLAPLLHESVRPDRDGVDAWTHDLVKETQAFMKRVLPLKEHEREFIERVGQKGEIAPELLTSDAAMQKLIREHAHLNWKAKNVKEKKTGA